MTAKVSVVLPVLITEPFLLSLTEFCIRAMRQQADQEYELIVVETGSKHLDPNNGGPKDSWMRIDKYLNFPSITSYTKDFNAGCDVADGEFIVHMGNDVIVNPGWVGALLEPFEKYADCGLSSCIASEPGAYIGPRTPVPLIVEGTFTPIMMFRNNWRLDEAYVGGYSDNDLIMRMYTAGLRGYRNCRVQVHHMNKVTWARSYPDKGIAQVEAGEKLFYERWGNSPLMMYAVIRAGGVAYGREHEFLLAQFPPYRQRVSTGGL